MGKTVKFTKDNDDCNCGKALKINDPRRKKSIIDKTNKHKNLTR